LRLSTVDVVASSVTRFVPAATERETLR
jgi:hypothetical protein